MIKNQVDTDRFKPDNSDETIRILNFPFSWKLWWKKKPLKNYRNCYEAKKHQAYKPSKISISIFSSTSWRLESRLWQTLKSLSLILSEEEAVKKRQGWVRLGRAGSMFWMIKLVLKCLWKCIYIFLDFRVIWMSSMQSIYDC